MPKFKAPNGKPIASVLESIICRSYIKEISADGASVEYAGSTEVFWDEQKPVEHNGSFVFLDEDGGE